MYAGALDRRITIERQTEGAADSYNAKTVSWAALATVWAARTDVSDAEKTASAQIGSALATRFTVRSTATTRTVTTLDRIDYDGGRWNILGVKETKHGRNQYLEITAIRGSDG